MLKTLLKKQLTEIFRSYFYDAKKNKMRSKGAVAAWFIFFVVIMVVVMGGLFTFLSLTLCGSLVEVGMGWLYFVLLSSIAILFGAFGSVFNTYSSLYLAKDNDLLLSMPIPLRTIIASRLINVYLMGTMYAATVLLPMLLVYWITAGATVSRVLCGILLFLLVTVFVLLLSCVLGWVVAKISLKLKHKSMITVLISLLFIGGYYFFYFKANDLLRDLISNAAAYGERIKGAAYGLYLFGRIGEGDWLATAIFLAAAALLCALVWRLLSRSFLRVATAGDNVGKIRYVEKKARQKTVFRALLGKELARFTSSANYMLNCGLGILLLPAAGVLLLLMGGDISETIETLLAARPGSAAVLLCTMLCMLASMNDMAAPSVSLEGKSLWIPQSLPVSPVTVLRAKTSMQLVLTVLPMLFASLSAAIAAVGTPAVRLTVALMPLTFAVFSAVFGTFVGLRMPLLHWTSEVAPIKQSGAVTLVLFSGWGFCLVLAGLYLLVGYRLGPALYLALWIAVLAAAGLAMQRWLDTKGAKIFAAL